MAAQADLVVDRSVKLAAVHYRLRRADRISDVQQTASYRTGGCACRTIRLAGSIDRRCLGCVRHAGVVEPRRIESPRTGRSLGTCVWRVAGRRLVALAGAQFVWLGIDLAKPWTRLFQPMESDSLGNSRTTSSLKYLQLMTECDYDVRSAAMISRAP